MRKLTIALGVLAAILVVLNVVTLIRLSEDSTQSDGPPPGVELARLKEEVNSLRGANAALQASLLAHQKGSQEAWEGLDLRTKLKWLFKVLRGEVDVKDERLAATTVVDFLDLIANRTEDPKAYAHALETAILTALEKPAPLDAAQQANLSRSLSTLKTSLSDLPRVDGNPSMLRGLEVEARGMEEVWNVLREDQRRALNDVYFWDILRMPSTRYLTSDVSIDELQQYWIHVYKLDPTIEPQLFQAADSYLASIGFSGELSLKKGKGSPKWFQFRLQALRKQMEVLETHEAALGKELMTRIRDGHLQEVMYPDGGNFQGRTWFGFNPFR